MPVGASKLGVLGAGLVPGGSVTFNTSGNWSVPPGVKKVSITGKGGTGNPGNAGNPGNPGNPGGGGAGGGSGASTIVGPAGNYIGSGGGGRPGGNAFKASTPDNWTSTNPLIPTVFLGGEQGNVPSNPPFNQANAGGAGQSGDSGNAGTAGNPGNPGNTGNSSSGLGNNFSGGAGGNAGVAGAAGNGGTGGQGGGGGGSGNRCSPTASGGAGGNGGGAGGSGIKQDFAQMPPTVGALTGGKGGGGAGAVNSGGSGGNASAAQNPLSPLASYAVGGSGQVTAPVIPPANPQRPFYPCIATNQMGGYGGTFFCAIRAGSPSLLLTFNSDSNPVKTRNCFNPPFVKPGGVNDPGATTPERIQSFTSNYNPGPLRPEVFRSGGGGAGSRGACSYSRGPSSQQFYSVGGGGGGGGRGNAGNAGGASPTPSGAAANPTTFNCVTVTPGSTTPIVVASPGGQIVISWNPQ